MAVVKIRKLTPPQITALREAYPKCVESGLLKTTNSIATFDFSVIGEPQKGLKSVESMVRHAALRDGSTPLRVVLDKLQSRPDLISEEV